MICQRCGMEMKKINYRHMNFCNRLPPPEELAAEYLESEKTYEEMSSDYDCSLNGLRTRVMFGLALLGECARPIGRARDLPMAGPAGSSLDREPERCGCGIILRTAVQRKRKTCDFCAGITFDYMRFRCTEPAVQRAIPVSVSLSL